MSPHVADLLTRPRVQVGIVVASLSALTLWAFSHVFISPASQACLDLYRSATSATDTARVDHFIPGDSLTRTPEARSCGSIRQFARWF